MGKPKAQKLVDGGDYLVQAFYGLNTATKNPKQLAPGEPQDSLNYITGWNDEQKSADNIQLRLGSGLLCKTRLGAGRVNSLAVGQDSSGNQIPFFAASGQYYYFDSVTGDFIAVTNGTLTDTEDMTLEFYQDLFGPYMYSGSPNTGINLISVANKQMISNLSSLQIVTDGITYNTGGYFTIRQNFGWLWNYLNLATGIAYKENLNQSNPDQVSTASTSIQNPQGLTGAVGDGVSTSFAGTINGAAQLMFSIQIAAPINKVNITQIVLPGSNSNSYDVYMPDTSAFTVGDYVVVQGITEYVQMPNDRIGVIAFIVANDHIGVTLFNASALGTGTDPLLFGSLSKVELYEDDGNGNLRSLLGSTGTVNYISGAFTINTQNPVPNGLNVDSIAFKGIPGVINFSAGFWAQFGGALQAVKFFANQLYQFHTLTTWLVNLGFASASSTTGTSGQQQYRQNLGTSYFRGAFEKGEGILFLDDCFENNPIFKILQIGDFTSAIEPEPLSDSLDLSQYDFSQVVVSNVDDYDFLSCESTLNATPKGYNNTCFLRNIKSGFFDKLDFRISCQDVYQGTVIAGDPITDNVFQLFTGVDDDGAPINNNWTSGQMNLGFSGLKRFNYFYIDGFIGPSQVLNIYAQFDSGNFILIGSIYGNGPYVDPTNSVVVGQGLSGLTPIGGMGNGQIVGYWFENQMPYYSPLFNYVAIKFVAGENLQTHQPAYGGLQLNAGWGFKDCRTKSVKQQPQYIGR